MELVRVELGGKPLLNELSDEPIVVSRSSNEVEESAGPNAGFMWYPEGADDE